MKLLSTQANESIVKRETYNITRTIVRGLRDLEIRLDVEMRSKLDLFNALVPC